MTSGGNVGFRSQLFLTVTVILAIVIIASTAVTFLVTRAQAYQSVGDLARAQVAQYARLGVFAAIVGPENKAAVDKFFDEMTGQQALVAVELRGSTGRSLGKWGSETGALGECGFGSRHEIVGRLEVKRRDGYWCAVGPILQSSKELAHGPHTSDSVIGELRIVDSVAETRRSVRRLAAWNVGAGTCVLGLGIFLAWRGVRRLTDPLDNLADVMRQLKGGKVGVRAELRGPKEVIAIASVFNELLGRVEEEALTLENEVEARTRELTVASDTARAAVRYKSVFMAMVTHEMRTPLHVITAHAMDVLSELEFIAEADAPRQQARVILRQADELLQRVNQILELARAESATGAIEMQLTDLAVLAAEMRERSMPLANEHGNVLEIECDPIVVLCDRDKLWVILSNLTTNACKFTRGGLIQVTVRAQNHVLELSVCDNGPGITSEMQDRLWREFSQVNRGNGRSAGFGLGLAIVKRLTEVLRGRVEMTSQPGSGTTVRVTVPLEHSMHAAPVVGAG